MTVLKTRARPHEPHRALPAHPAPRRHALAAAALATVAAATGLLAPPEARARITRIEVTTHESPTFGGYAWPGVGPYEKLAGKAYGEVNPLDPKNAVITDIQLAPRNARGMVEYAFDFYILKPVDLKKGAHKVMYEPPNRGGKTWASFGRMPGGNDPGSVTDPAVLANAFLMPRGYTMVWSGWDFAAGTNSANFNSTITLPVARNADGSSITGPAYEYIVSGAASFTLSYPAATLDKSKAKLTHRVHLDDVPVEVPAAGWNYNATGTAISLAGGNFVANDIYEFSYTAKDPTVNGLGFAAVRDFNAWLREARHDDAGNANPLAGDVRRIYTEVVSQPGRLLNDFRHLGFNQAESGRQVFDGLMQWIAAGDGINMNYRFSQPGRTERNRQDHLYVEGVFPFANVTTTDPFTGRHDSRLARCERTRTCPVAAEIYSANEYWVKAASLLHTTPDGRFDLPDSPYARNYFISSHQHGTGNAANKGVCQQFQNPLNSAPIQRALFLALDEWVHGRPPPKSRVPRLRDGTFAMPLPTQAAVGFPAIPGVTYTGLKTTRYLLDYGPDYYTKGIPTLNPPLVSAPYQENPANGPIYPSYVPKTDSDGNDIAGVRLADVSVPLATYTGWALRAGAQANDGCEAAGQYIPFAKTAAARAASGDPRPSVQERYANFDVYRSAIDKALDKLVQRRLMLCEDTAAEQTRLYAAGVAAGLAAPAAGVPAPSTLPHCRGGQHGDDDDDDDDDGGHGGHRD